MLMEGVLPAVLHSSMCQLLKHAKSMDVLNISSEGASNAAMDTHYFTTAANCPTV